MHISVVCPINKLWRILRELLFSIYIIIMLKVLKIPEIVFQNINFLIINIKGYQSGSLLMAI